MHTHLYYFLCYSFQVETIGDAYMVAAGLLETSKNHAYAVTKFSFLMREAAQSIKRPTDDTPLRVREPVTYHMYSL